MENLNQTIDFKKVNEAIRLFILWYGGCKNVTLNDLKEYKKCLNKSELEEYSIMKRSIREYINGKY